MSRPADDPTPRLTEFLYRLMRDEVPTGVVRRLIDEVRGPEVGRNYSAPELEALARRYAADLARRP